MFVIFQLLDGALGLNFDYRIMWVFYFIIVLLINVLVFREFWSIY